MRTIPILNVKAENSTTKTLTLKDNLCSKAKPGQFLMLWIPRVDEIPLSIMNSHNGKVSITVKSVGTATSELLKMKKGEMVGVRGPFGNFFTENIGKILLIGGGTGIAPLFFLTKKIAKKAKKLTIVIGAKIKNELLFLSSLSNLCRDQILLSTTEDGSYGLKCVATEPLNNLLNREKYDMIYACGPEPMLRNVFEIANIYKIPMEASLERLMRCGIGLCGSCVIGKYRVCRDGPVFNSAQLNEIKDEFGLLKLDQYGKSVSL